MVNWQLSLSYITDKRAHDDKYSFKREKEKEGKMERINQVDNCLWWG